MQSTHKISGDAAAGFAAYLTQGGGRGDYYVGGVAEGEAGRWEGSPGALGLLGLAPGGRVERGALVALMGGRHPVSGQAIRRVGGDGSRVAGIDLTFSAPKSVSALWAVSGPYRRAQIEAAHRGAVASAMGRVEREVELVRRRRDGVLRWEPARRLVRAEFVHTSSRLTRAQEGEGVPDPQLHSHVVVLAAQRRDGRFAAVDSRELFRSARVNGAWYRAELAYSLGELGVEVRGRAGKDGRYFEASGVPGELAKRWSARTDDIDRAALAFRDRYGRAPRAGELGGLTVATRGTKTALAQVDVDQAWRAVGEEYGLGRARAEALFGEESRHEVRPVARELLGVLGRERSMVERRELGARALEVAAGVMRPADAQRAVTDLARSGELVELEGGLWTTRELRELEQRTLSLALERAGDESVAVPGAVVDEAREAAGARVGAPLTGEQSRALQTVTGAGGAAVLVGQAGTGKGVVIDAAREAWERDGRRVIGTAVAGATAKRLGADAGMRETMTVDALARRHGRGTLGLDARSVVVVDEAGMADTRRLHAVMEAAGESRSKVLLVGDQAQLSSIGAGGLFGEIAGRVPAAELTEVHRAHHGWERDAWAQLRAGDAAPALAGYADRRRLHVHDTRADAGERMVEDWARARAETPADRVVMLTDASNAELDRLNAMAQRHRAAAGELGQRRAGLPDRPYDLAAGDEVMLTGQLRPPGEERVENGTRGSVLSVDDRTDRVVLRTDEPQPRDVAFSTREFRDVRLAYAQHVYKAQGLTTDRAMVLMGGWQSDRERGYVALSRARERTDIYVSRDDLGREGTGTDLLDRLALRVAASHAQQASVTRDAVPNRFVSRDDSAAARQPTGREPAESAAAPEVESRVGRVLREQREREQARGRDHGIE
jgi:conjugative relaxase-like TrwC/TraI family protein